MNFTSLSLLSGILIFVLGSCYSPSGENFNDIELPEAPPLTVNLSGIEGDTIGVAAATQFQYSISTPNEIFVIQIEINNRVVEESFNQSDIDIYIDPDQFNKGIHRLELLVYVKSNTGSIADGFDAEQFLYNGVWFLEIDKSPPEPIEITNMSVDQSGLTIEWEKYEKSTIQEYQINFHDLSEPYTINRSFSIENRNTTSHTFTDYIGQELRVSLSVVTDFGTATGNQITFDEKTTRLLPSVIVGDRVQLRWNKNQFPNHFRSYKLYTNTPDNPEFRIQLFNSENINDTTFTFEQEVFIGDIDLKLEVWPKEVSFFGHPIIDISTIPVSEPTFEIPNNGRMYLQSGNIIAAYDSSISIIDTTDNNIINQVQANNASKTRIFMLAGRTLEDGTETIVTLNSSTLEVENSVTMRRITGVNIKPQKIKASRNSALAILSTGTTAYIFNSATGSTQRTYPLSSESARVDISADGNLVLIDRMLYALENGELVRVNNNTDNIIVFSNTGDFYYEIEPFFNTVITKYENNNRTPLSTTEVRRYRTTSINNNQDENVFIARGYYTNVNSPVDEPTYVVIDPEQGISKDIRVFNRFANYYYLDGDLYTTDNFKKRFDFD